MPGLGAIRCGASGAGCGAALRSAKPSAQSGEGSTFSALGSEQPGSGVPYAGRVAAALLAAGLGPAFLGAPCAWLAASCAKCRFSHGMQEAGQAAQSWALKPACDPAMAPRAWCCSAGRSWGTVVTLWRPWRRGPGLLPVALLCLANCAGLCWENFPVPDCGERVQQPPVL